MPGATHRDVMLVGFAALVVVVVGVGLAARRAIGDDCVHSCPSTEWDAQGCCPAKAKPPPPKPTPPKKAESKPPPAKLNAPKLDIRGADASVAGAQVSVDDVAQGQAPVVVETTPGRHRLEIKKDGFDAFVKWVDIKGGEVQRVVVALKSRAPAPTPAPALTPTPTNTRAVCPTGTVHVPGGTFTMGDEGDRYASPVHQVTMSGFCMDKTEVTVAAYLTCIAAGTCSAPGVEGYCNPVAGKKNAHPINCVDWNQAKTYCEWAGSRLPTEAEWEYAARGTDGRMYPWGNATPSWPLLNWSSSGTEPVGSFIRGASPFGVLDMAGNVSEWVADLDGPYSSDAQTNPTGATSGTLRVNRGGGFTSRDAGYVRATFRTRADPRHEEGLIGFRCARGD